MRALPYRVGTLQVCATIQLLGPYFAIAASYACVQNSTTYRVESKHHQANHMLFIWSNHVPVPVSILIRIESESERDVPARVTGRVRYRVPVGVALRRDAVACFHVAHLPGPYERECAQPRREVLAAPFVGVRRVSLLGHIATAIARRLRQELRCRGARRLC